METTKEEWTDSVVAWQGGLQESSGRGIGIELTLSPFANSMLRVFLWFLGDSEFDAGDVIFSHSLLLYSNLTPVVERRSPI